MSTEPRTAATVPDVYEHGIINTSVIEDDKDGEIIPVANNERVRLCRVDKSILRLFGAMTCILVMIATWVAMAEKLQGLNEGYPHPYFNTFWVHCSYTVLYIMWKIWVLFPGGFSCNKVGEGALIFDRKLLVWSAIISLASMITAYTWYLSLTRTNIPANTAIYQSGAAFVFIISVPLLKERVTLLKIVCVCFSVTGVSLVAFFSSKNDCVRMIATVHVRWTSSRRGPCAENSTWLGYVLLVVSVIFYALLETLYKKFGTKKDDPAAVANGVRFVGMIGVHTLFWMWPPIIILHYSGFEVFCWPDLKYFRLMVLNAALDVVFNGALLVCIALSSPLFASVGSILAIPTSVVVDWIVQGEDLKWQAYIGIVFIICGFLGFSFSEFIATRRERKHRLKIEMISSCESQTITTISSSGESEPLLHSKAKKDKKPIRVIIKEHIY